MHIDNFASGNSVLHHLDPRIKIVVAALFSVVVALADKYACLSAALCVSLALLLLARLPLKQVLLRLLAVNTFILFLWVFLPFTYGGKELFTVGPLAATREGVAYALIITVKSNTIVLALIALLGTSPVITLGHALSHLYVPDKLIHLFFFSLRYLQVLHLEYERLRDAMRIRGFKPGTNLHTYRTFAYLVGMLLIKSVDRADRIRKAMLCRGFHGKLYVLSHFELQRKDVFMFVFMVLIVSGMAALQWIIPK
ncbi:MAG: cobalt ECF transporter T component CbiQ [Deltaproteobacteria bacterium]|nr:MAG: cobalt ECF transporter T component CbiQ [Deltaproteobacteria bacterium]